MKYFKTALNYLFNILCIGILIASSTLLPAQRKLTRRCKETFENVVKVTDQNLLYITKYSGWTDQVKVHLLELLAWDPKLYLNHKEIKNFRSQLELALKSFGKPPLLLYSQYAHEKPLPKFSASDTKIPIIQDQFLKIAIDKVCTELTISTVANFDKRIKTCKKKIKLISEENSAANRRFQRKDNHQSIKTCFVELLKVMDKKRMHVKDIRVLEQDYEQVTKLKKCIISGDQELNLAIEKTLKANEDYRNTLIKEAAEKALVANIHAKLPKKNKQIFPDEPKSKKMLKEVSPKSLIKEDSDLNHINASIAEEDLNYIEGSFSKDNLGTNAAPASPSQAKPDESRNIQSSESTEDSESEVEQSQEHKKQADMAVKKFDAETVKIPSEQQNNTQDLGARNDQTSLLTVPSPEKPLYDEGSWKWFLDFIYNLLSFFNPLRFFRK